MVVMANRICRIYATPINFATEVNFRCLVLQNILVRLPPYKPYIRLADIPEGD